MGEGCWPGDEGGKAGCKVRWNGDAAVPGWVRIFEGVLPGRIGCVNGLAAEPVAPAGVCGRGRLVTAAGGPAGGALAAGVDTDCPAVGPVCGAMPSPALAVFGWASGACFTVPPEPALAAEFMCEAAAEAGGKFSVATRG